MTNENGVTLAEIRAVITEYDKATAIYEALPPAIWDAKATADITRARNRLVSSAPDYLRALMPVVEAAVAYRNSVRGDDEEALLQAITAAVAKLEEGN